MNKTGIAIIVTSNGVGQPVVANPGEWLRHTGDIRPVLARVTPPCVRGSQPLIYMTFSASGTYIAIVRAISGRQGDNVAAWLYIPDGIDISGKEIAGIIRRLDDIIAAGRLPDEATLTREFSESYATGGAQGDSFASDPHGPLAMRRVETGDADKFAEALRRMPCYAGYCGVVLAGAEQTVADAVDITDSRAEYAGPEIQTAHETAAATAKTTESDKPSGYRFGLCPQWQPYALGAVGGFVLGLLVAWLIGYCGSHRLTLHAGWPPVSIVEIIQAPADTLAAAQTDTVAGQSKKFTAKQLAVAVAYLDTHKAWNKTEMDSIAPIAGLWDAVNECRHDSVAVYRRRLDASETLKAVADTLALFASEGLYGVPVNAPGDTVINVETYGKSIRAAKK